MRTWESGRESVLLDDIIAGRKTVEGRLNRDKFAAYEAGDEVLLRRDFRDASGVLHDGKPEVRVRIVAIRRYDTFLDMITAEDFRRVIPAAQNAHEAAELYNRYYSAKNQAVYGVLGIEIELV